MRDNMRGALTQEVTRKQFLQYIGTAFLMVFGLNNLVSLLTGTKPKHILGGHNPADGKHGFGNSKFGV